MAIFVRVAGDSIRRRTPGRPTQKTRWDWGLGSRNRGVLKVAGSRGWIGESYSLLLRGPGSRKNLSKVGAIKFRKRYIVNKDTSSLVIDKLSSRIGEDRISVIYHYCNFQNRKSHVAACMLVSLLKQVVDGLGAIPAEIGDAFEAKQGSNGRGLSVSDVLKLLEAAFKCNERTFICIDALDECATEHRPEFLRSLHSIVRNSPNVRLFVTGRPHIQTELEKHHGKSLHFILFKPVKGDIRRYLEMKLEDDSFCEAMDSELKRDIMQAITEMISEMYVDEPLLGSAGH